MALIVLLPLFVGVLLTGRHWYTARRECLKPRSPTSTFYPCGHMTEEVAALRRLDHEITK